MTQTSSCPSLNTHRCFRRLHASHGRPNLFGLYPPAGAFGGDGIFEPETGGEPADPPGEGIELSAAKCEVLFVSSRRCDLFKFMQDRAGTATLMTQCEIGLLDCCLIFLLGPLSAARLDFL